MSLTLRCLLLSVFSLTSQLTWAEDQAFGAVLDCSRLLSKTENTICNNPELLALDLKLSIVYAQAETEAASTYRESGQRVDPLAREQSIWLRARNQCKSNACFHSAYIRRIKYIETHWLHR